MHRSLLVLSLLLSACASLGQRPREFYMTQQPRTWSDSTMNKAYVNMLERTLFQINYVTDVSRRHGHEEVACFPVNGEGEEFWVLGFLEPANAYIRERDGVTGVSCPNGYGMIHWHPFGTSVDGGLVDPCKPSYPADVKPEYSFVPVFLLVCGRGMDSLVAYRVRNR